MSAAPSRDWNVFKQIFADHWESFQHAHPRYQTSYYDGLVTKMLACGNPEKMGYLAYRCLHCGQGQHLVAMSCKSSLCLRCAKVYVDNWVSQVSQVLHEGVIYRHIILTLPAMFRTTFYQNAEVLLSTLMRCGAQCLDDFYSTVRGKALKGGYITVLHTHGRNGQYHPHLHLLATSGGYDAPGGRWEHVSYLPYALLRRKWQWHLLSTLRKTLKTEAIHRLVDVCFRKYPNGLVTNVQKGQVPSQYQSVARYVAKYVVSPPISVRRIDHYDGEWVTYHYRSHRTERMEHETVTVETFIGRMIQHIMPKGFKRIRYYGVHVVGRYDDCRIYCYGGYEAAFLRRMSKVVKHQDVNERLCSRLVNVLSVIYAHIYFPTYSNGLKDIGKFLGFRWTAADASGIQSIVWRRKWEETCSVTFKDMLTTYNLEDCAALKRVTEFLYAACSSPCEPHKMREEGPAIARVEEISPQRPRPDWGDIVFALPDFSFVNERAHFDYQRDKVFVRTSKTLQRDQGRKGTKRWKKNRRVNREVELSTQSCSFCRGTELTRHQNRSLARLAFDLRITRSGIKRWVTRYRTTWHHCAECGKRFLPSDYLRLEEFCHSLKSWAMYEHVAHRTSLPNIADTIRECFNMPLSHPQVHAFKQLLADYYQGTYKRLLEKIVGGPLLHVDETEVRVRRVGKGYVWVFTNLEEVVYLYRASREGDFLHDLLKDFRGVLVSDFYAAYDSLHCPQQKCLVHLLRDFNQDIVGNPWDEDLKSLAAAFGSQLRTVVATIDQYGLRQQHLGKHRRDVEQFFQAIAAASLRSEVAEGYRKRLLKYQDKLFTFLDYDGVPWNNNNAEHAVKGFAYYREVADNLMTEGGLKHYLVLLSVFQTCKYKRVSFLKFLVSGETDIDVFSKGRGERVLPMIELYPDGMESSRPSRKRLGVQAGGEGAMTATALNDSADRLETPDWGTHNIHTAHVPGV